MIEAGAPNTGDCWHAFRGVRVPPGVDMLSPPEVPRNAERAQSEGRASGGWVDSAACSEVGRVRNRQWGKGSVPDLGRYCTGCPRPMHRPHGRS